MPSPSVALLRTPASPAVGERAQQLRRSVVRRRRLFLGLSLTGLLAIVLAFAVLSGPSAERGPATGAAAIVPADALAYVHVSIDSTRPAVRRAMAVAARFPDFPRLANSLFARLTAIAGGGKQLDYNRDIRPWLGREAAFAVLDTSSSSAATLIVLDVSRRRQAQAFVTGAGATPAGAYEGVRLYQYSTGTELAFVRHYLALGQDQSVREAIDAAKGRSPSLRDDPAYRRASADEPAGRLLDAYVSAAGVRRLLEPRTGLLGALGVLLDKPSLLGTAISISAADGGIRVHVHSALDPALAGLSGSRPTQFAPTLPGLLPSHSMLMLDVAGLAHAAPSVLQAAARLGLLGQVAPLLHRLGAALAAEGVNVPSILSLFDRETAVAVGPTGSLIIVTRTRDEEATRATLAGLAIPLAQLFPPAAGSAQGPELNDQQVAGVTAHQLALEPGLNLYWAVWGGLLVVSTGRQGIAQVAHHEHSLADDRAYRTALGEQPDKVTSLLFLDLSQLLSLGEQTGLTSSARFGSLQADLAKVRAIGLHSTSGESDTTAELLLQIP